MSVSGVESGLHIALATSTVGSDAKREDITREVDGEVSTHTSLQHSIEEQSTMRKIWDVVIQVVFAPFKLVLSVLGVIKSAWDGVLNTCKFVNAAASLELCEGANKGVVEKLLAHVMKVDDTDRISRKRLSSLHIVVGCAKDFLVECSPKEAQYIKVVVSYALASLPASVLSEMRSRLSSNLSEASYEEMEKVVSDMYKALPSVSLRILESAISRRKGNKTAQLEIITLLERVTVSDAEPEVTEDSIKQEVLRISQLVRDSIREDEESLKVVKSVTSGVQFR